MKRKTLTSAVLAGFLTLPLLVSAQELSEIEQTATCTGGTAQALAVFNAVYLTRDKTPPNNATKLSYVDDILTHAGVDTTAWTVDERACMFVVGVVWRDARDRYIAARRAARQEDVQATVDTNVAADLAEFDTPQ